MSNEIFSHRDEKRKIDKDKPQNRADSTELRIYEFPRI
jgi:hypothetical protein